MSSTPFMMSSSNLLNPPGIEKILDTTLTKVSCFDLLGFKKLKKFPIKVFSFTVV